MSGERLGIPAVSIMTEKFVNAAALMSQVLGAGDLPFVVIAHPISSAPTAELTERATTTADEIAAILLG